MANPPPLIAITGYGQPGDLEASFQAGVYDHLTKPVDVDKLVALLDRLLECRRFCWPVRRRPRTAAEPGAL